MAREKSDTAGNAAVIATGPVRLDFTKPAFEFWEVAERDGLKAALNRRDNPFKKD